MCCFPYVHLIDVLLYFQTTERSRFYGTLHPIPRQTVSSHRNSNERVQRLSMTSLHALKLPRDQCDVNTATTSISNWTQLEFKQQGTEQSKQAVVAVVMGITSRKLLSESDSRSSCRIHSEVDVKWRLCNRVYGFLVCIETTKFAILFGWVKYATTSFIFQGAKITTVTCVSQLLRKRKWRLCCFFPLFFKFCLRNIDVAACAVRFLWSQHGVSRVLHVIWSYLAKYRPFLF